VPCSQCDAIEQQFDDREAQRQLRRLRRRGPARTTKLLIDAVRHALGDTVPQDLSLLDIGAGVGAIHHALLGTTVAQAIHVDASSAHISVARAEADRLGHSGQVDFRLGDFVAMADAVPAMDVVTLDRVICCYPNMEELVAASASRARRLYGAVFPRERSLVKAFIVMSNFARRLGRNSFRSYMHPVDAIDAAIERQGLRRCSVTQTVAWRVAVYSR